MPDFVRGAATIHYEAIGRGKPLLLIAGTASDSASWGPLLELLPGRRLILIDNRGSGRTRVEGPLDHGEMIEDCAALLDHMGIRRADVVGHSLGALLALGLAARHPARVRKVVSLCLGFVDHRTRAVFSELAQLYFIVPPETFFRLLYPWLFSSPFFADPARVAAAAAASTDYRHRQSPGDFARQIAALDHPVRLDLTGIAAPVLAIAAELDLLASPSAVAAAHASIPDLELLTLEDAAHSVHWEQPAAVAEAILAFLGD